MGGDQVKPHAEQAVVDGATIECRMHGSRFDLRTGAALNPPATTPVTTYPVRVVDGHIHVFCA